MSKEAALKFAEMMNGSEELQEAIRTCLNEFAGTLVDIGKRNDLDVVVDDVGTFLAETFFTEGSYPETSSTRLFSKLVSHIRSTDADSANFVSMDLGSDDDFSMFNEHFQAAFAQVEEGSDDESNDVSRASEPPQESAEESTDVETSDVAPVGQASHSQSESATPGDVPEQSDAPKDSEPERKSEEDAAPWNAEQKPWWKLW